MDSPTLNAKKRTITGKKVNIGRRLGKIPAVLYGHGIASKNLSLDKSEFQKIYRQAGISTLVDLKIDDDKHVKILIHSPQKHPVTQEPLHADLYQVKMTEKIRTDIPLHFINIAPAVEELEGNLITNRDGIEVECLPDALVPEIEVDLSTLKTFDDLIHISDIHLPEGIETLLDPEEAVALVTPPRSEEELAEELAETAVEKEKAQIEQIEEAAKPSEEGEETAESAKPSEENPIEKAS